MLGRHPPVFAPSPGSGSAVRGAASAAAPFWVRLGGLLAAESSFRSCWSAIVSGPPSPLTAAAYFSDTLVSHIPKSSAVFLWQGALVSRSSAARGASNWLGALVSRTPVFPAATIPFNSSSLRMFVLSFSILQYCRVPITLQACHLHLPTSEHLYSDSAT